MARDRIQLIAIAFLLAWCTVFGASYSVGEGWPALSSEMSWLFTAAATVAFAGALVGVRRLCDKAHEAASAQAANAQSSPSHKDLFIIAGIILLCWAPWLIANLPGSTYWDTYWQMWQVYPEAHPVALIQWPAVQERTLTDAWLVDHHPVLTTLVYGGAAWVSDQLTGSWMAGVFALSAAQTIAYAFLFAGPICELRRWRTPRWARIGVLLWICFLPPVPTWAACVVKDSAFGLFFLPWFISLANAARTNGATLSNRRTAIIMTACALLMCLMKKTGIFIVVTTALVGCVLFRKTRPARRSFAVQGALCLGVMAVLLPCLIFPAANIAPGGAQEMLGPALQQTARYAQDHELTEDEAAVVSEVVDVDRVLHHYDADFQDNVKYYYHPDATGEELAAYAQLYLRQGLEDPGAYLGSVMALAGRYVSPTTYLNIRMVTVDTKIGDEQRAVLWNPDALDGLRLGLEGAYQAVAQIPGLNAPFLTVVYVLWLPACALYVLTGRQRRSPQHATRYGILFAPLAVMIAFCVIAPVFDARYAWGLLLAAPILFALMVTPREQSEQGT